MRIPKDARDITLAVLTHPDLHWSACFEDVSGRLLDVMECCCPLKPITDKILQSKEE